MAGNGRARGRAPRAAAIGQIGAHAHLYPTLPSCPPPTRDPGEASLAAELATLPERELAEQVLALVAVPRSLRSLVEPRLRLAAAELARRWLAQCKRRKAA